MNQLCCLFTSHLQFDRELFRKHKSKANSSFYADEAGYLSFISRAAISGRVIYLFIPSYRLYQPQLFTETPWP